ncbi:MULTISPECIES: YbaB/EbfC family nucleoid-associated protein [Actinosynnema]|uniref:Nucleoid-associated protein n=1 Tax=Actinosynnema pretiosum TaxID=42197 RepID=A0A290ZC27_9PSEU|nr:YbaB/EbfC family nucleoid-associated protein [Actinosynnema pretiosum]ATE56591.1 hypothetical protein CNX65_27660 [Actinosynnema pretiosum]
MRDRQQRLEHMKRTFEEQSAKAGDVQRAMRELRGQGRSPDGAVTVTAAPSGAVVDLQLTEEALRRTPSALRADILSAIQMATQNATQLLDDAVGPITGNRLERIKQGLRHRDPAQEPGDR